MNVTPGLIPAHPLYCTGWDHLGVGGGAGAFPAPPEFGILDSQANRPGRSFWGTRLGGGIIVTNTKIVVQVERPN